VILEAAAYGIPVVAPDVGSCRELIEGNDPRDQRHGGIVTPLVAPEATAEAIQRILSDTHVRNQMGAFLRERLLRDYDYRRIVAEYRELHSDLGSR
jgi:glycosyltransferase involved in cell wall biosynthesis